MSIPARIAIGSIRKAGPVFARLFSVTRTVLVFNAGLIFTAGLLILASGLGWGWAGAAEQFPSSPNHRGIVAFDPYIVFPESRVGNGVYLEERLIFAAPGTAILDVLPLPVDGRFTYYAQDSEGTESLGAFISGGDTKPKVRKITRGVFHLSVSLQGVLYKKLYRVVEGKLLDLLPNSKTADGAVAGETGVLFYHVASTILEDEEGQPKSAFGLRLHLSLFEEERTRHLGYLLVNGLPSIKMSWLDESKIEIVLADGRTQILSISQFQ